MKRGLNQNSGEVDISYYDGRKKLLQLVYKHDAIEYNRRRRLIGRTTENEQGESGEEKG